MPCMQRAIPAVPMCPTHRGRYRAGCAACQKYARYRWRIQQLPDNPAGWVPVGPTQRRLRALFDSGMSWRQIADELGAAPEHLSRISLGYRKHVTRGMEEAVKAIEPGQPHRCGKYVPAIGMLRRIRALCCIGYTYAEQAELAGMGYVEFCRKANQPDDGSIRPSTERKVRDMYEKVCMTPSTRPGLRALQRAERNGWVSPLAWDEDTIDDPAAEPNLGANRGLALPDEAAIVLAMDGRMADVGRPLNKAEKRAVAWRAARLGWSNRRIGELTGVSNDAIQKVRAQIAGEAAEGDDGEGEL